ncbi:MAG: 4'-phosphopantetheinyl transferase superfamily protein [Bacteroidales bacterium]|nr:4'-phosphopantetheinyl transferase superfamily protein [Bacteroidales bacterium]
MIEVFAIQLVEDKIFEAQKEELLGYLPNEGSEAVLRHKTVKGAQRSLIGELVSRIIIGQKISVPIQEIDFKKTLKGKPYLENDPIRFNISHSGDWVVLAVAEIDVGIDVEKIRQINYRIAERFFSAHENSLMEKKEGTDKLNLFFDFWTLKESYLKLLGTGLTKSLSSFTIVRKNDKFALLEDSNKKQEPVFLKQYNLAGNYKLSVCSYKDDFCKELKILTINEFMQT